MRLKPFDGTVETEPKRWGGEGDGGTRIQIDAANPSVDGSELVS